MIDKLKTIFNIYSSVFIILQIGEPYPCFVQSLETYQEKYNHRGHNHNHGQLEDSAHFGEVVQVRFLTKLRSKRDVHRNAYHVLEIQRSMVLNSTMMLHVTKNEHLLSQNFTFKVYNIKSKRKLRAHPPFPQEKKDNKDLGSTDEMSNHCIYSGVLTGTDTGTEALDNSSHVALSACGELPGFTGLITTSEGTFALEPVSPQKTEEAETLKYSDGRIPKGFQIPHKLTLLSRDEGRPSRCGGVIYGGEFEEKSATDTEAIQSARYNDDDNNNRKDSLVTWTANKMPVPMELASQPQSPEVDKEQTSNRSSGKRVIKMAIFADEAFVELYMKKLNTKSAKVIKNYILVLVQSTANFYQLPSLDTKIDLTVVYIELFTKNPSSLKTHHGLHIPYLKSFCDYISILYGEHSNWDHVMMLTGLDLKSQDTIAVLGIAYIATLCSRLACSVIEARYLNAPQTMAHELGHSIGIQHDGESENLACSPNTHIMAALVDPINNAWSTCSNKNMNDFITKLETRFSRFGNKRDCFKASEMKKYNFNSKLPGERFKPDHQCLLYSKEYPIAVTSSTAARFIFKEKEPYNVCKRLYCSDKLYKYSHFIHAALEGTECETGKWCRNWECVTKE